MKRVLVAVVVVVAGLLAYNYYSTGTLSLVPDFSLTEEEQALQDLNDRFRAARKEFDQAGRGAALSGIDTSAEAEAALLEIDRVEKALAELNSRLSSEAVKREAESLERSIREFKQDLG